MSNLQACLHDSPVALAVNISSEPRDLPELAAAEQPVDFPLSASVRRLSTAVERTVDKLGRSLSAKSSSVGSPSSPGHRRMFSLSRKGKEKQKSGSGEENVLSPTSASTPSASRPTSPMPPRSSHDDSPFITPPSPPLAPTRPSLSPWRGDGSMRAGTQTLIQALQALPWNSDPDVDDDVLNHGLHPIDEPESDGEPSSGLPLASSIHTIYRPLARSRRMTGFDQNNSRSRLPLRGIPSSEDEPSSSDEIVQSDEETDNAEDFEDTTPKLPDAQRPAHLRLSSMSYLVKQESALSSDKLPDRVYMSRSGSMATVRLQRRAKLAEKLREVFELEGIEEVRAELPCWLLRSVLLQGYMYLTNSYLCFFAHLPSREHQILKSGSLYKKAQRTKRWIKHWFVLKNDALSWYQSSSDPYFPHGIVDLRYAISCEATGEKGFRLRTNQKTVMLSADSVPSREEWVKAIKKVIFKAQNMGESVKIAIPYSAVLDVEKSSAMDFSETIEVKVYDKEARDHFSVDSFFFAYFHDLSTALDQIRDAVRSQRTVGGNIGYTVLDTTAARNQVAPATLTTPDRTLSLPSSTSLFKMPSLLRPFSDPRAAPTTAPTTNKAVPDVGEDFTHISKRANSTSFVPVTRSPSPSPSSSPPKNSGSEAGKPSTSLKPAVASLTPTTSNAITDSSHTYPPSTLVSSPSTEHYSLPHRPSTVSSATTASSSSSSWVVGVPSWLKVPRTRTLFGTSTVDTTLLPVSPPGGRVREMYSTGSNFVGSRWSGIADLAYSVLETPDVHIEEEAVEKFRSYFAYDEKENLLGYFPGYIFRLLPVYGKLYVSTNFFCFKSSGPLTSRTRMTLPIRDILSMEKSKPTRFGHHGLTVIVRGHEEIFFEFNAEDMRDSFVKLLEGQIEDVRSRLKEGDSLPTPGQREALILEEFEPRMSMSIADVAEMTDSLPAVMFTSASSTFLTFKPRKSLHFTFLTIGSRGDVQPYIALAKGLMADGHRVRIATHGEFREWIESYGIEYGYVGGDPAELMRICVENGMFTVSFLKETLQKFRGWLDDLLKTSWEACQGTDVLVESPSAMGGYHIAEALSIPYFRAFTMTWTRTRAYPHAFAVPERKMGGGYNYMSYVVFDQVFWRAISGQINRWRRNLLNLGSTSLDKMEPHKVPFLYNFSPSVVPPPLDWPEWIRVTGYWFLDDADVGSKKWSPPPELVKFIDSAHSAGKKVVYIGFGSIVVSDPRAMTRCVIDAIVQSGVYAILSKGWSDRLHPKSGDAAEPEEPLPPQIYSITSIPHDWLFRRIDAACHHGGAGTTGASLRAGIPTVIKPFFGDQFFWADRIEALGVGTGVRKLTVDSLTEALSTATSDPKQIDRARLLGEQIRSENGVATAIESIYRDLDYARSLIKRPVLDSDDEDLGTEDSTIRNRTRAHSASSEPRSGYSSNGSVLGAPSEDWSVISDQDDRRSSFSSGNSDGRPTSPSRSAGKRASISTMLSAFSNPLNTGSSRRRTLSQS